MKKIVTILMSLICILELPVLASGDSQSISLPEVGLSISIPEEYTVLTRSATASQLAAYGITKADWEESMESTSIYMSAIKEDMTEEIVVTMQEFAFSDLNELPDSSVEAMVSMIKSGFEEAGVTVTDTEIYHHNQTKFAVLNEKTTLNGITSYALQYYTVYDGKAINITFHSYIGPITSAQKSFMQQVIDTVEFDADPQPRQTPEDTPSFIYTDPETELFFEVPSNWQEKSLSKPRIYLEAKFKSNDEENLIMYGSVDFWSELSDTEQVQLDRSTITADMFSVDELKDLVGSALEADDAKCSKMTINDIPYMRAEYTTTGDVFGFSAETPVIACYSLYNGYIYIFYYAGSEGDLHYSDFLSLLESVQYPEIPVIEGKTGQKETAGQKETTGAAPWVLLGIITAGILIFLIVRAIIKKEPEMKDSEDFPEGLTDNQNDNPYYCRFCGKRLPEQSKFCPYCGKYLE